MSGFLAVCRTYPLSVSIILLVILYEALVGLAWAILDIAVRMGIWPRGLFGFEAYNFIASVTFWQEVAFFAGVVANIVALVLFVRRSRRSFEVFLFAFVMDKIDWLMLAGNFSYDAILANNADLSGYLTLVAQGTALYLIFRMRIRNALS